MVLRMCMIIMIVGVLIPIPAADDICITRLEKVNCSDKEKSELHYICESKSGDNCSCVFENPIRSEIGWSKTCQTKNSRAVRKKKVRKRQTVDQNLCGTIAPPRPGKVSCTMSRKEIKCFGTCDLDHQFIDGKQEQIYSCLYSEGVWTPVADFPRCEPKCSPPCENGGTCLPENFCSCPNDFRGDACQYPISLCTIAKNKFASNWQCNHTRSETTCDISCHPPDTPEAEMDVNRYGCSTEGVWKPQLPPCVRVPMCDEPKAVLNGRWELVIGTILSAGSRIANKCDNGYILSGEKYSECYRNGTWSSEAPLCVEERVVVSCQDPGDIAYGERNSSSVGFLEGTSVEYACAGSRTMVGNAVITCMANGLWSSNKPQCVLKGQEPAFCSKPSAPKNSMVHITFPGQHPLATLFNNYTPVARLLQFINFAQGEGREIAHLPEETFVVGTRIQYKCKSRFYKLYGSEYQTCLSTRTWSGYQPACVPECGKSDIPKTPFIVNGNSSRIGQWPWQVGLAMRSSTGLHLLCGGVLINELWILTAAHCVARRLSNVPMDTRDLIVFCGKYFRNFDRDDEYVQVKQVKQIIIHEEYDFVHFDVDIALIQLESPVDLTTRVRPICLPTDDTTRENIRDGKTGITTGWGITETGKFSETLKEAVLPVVSHDRCEEAYRRGLRSVTITKNMFCAGYESGNTDTCNGDSGGPLMFAVGPANDNRWYLEGIVSWGSESGCGKALRYSGFTKVGEFVPWINMIV